MSVIGRRCTTGCATWPDDDKYETCPVCNEQTVRFNGLTPLSHAEAEKRRKHAEFDQYYESEHVQDTTPLTASELRELHILAD